MNKKVLLTFLVAPLLVISSCSKGNGGGDSSGGGGGSGVQPSHDNEEVQKYMEDLKETSKGDHFYLHYYRFAQKVEDYNKYDVWAWAALPKHGEGYRFDWDGRVTSNDRLSASGDTKIDSFGYACCDIDLTKEYDGGWNDTAKTMGGKKTDFYYYEDGKKVGIDDAIGIQIVVSATRVKKDADAKFWSNDGGDQKVILSEYALENADGTTSYHAFVTQDQVSDMTPTPPMEHTDPFENDDGTNYTYGKAKYSDVDFTKTAAKQATSPLFLNGSGKAAGSGDILQYGAGVGYQIMVSSFADSDGDGFGDILGITKKLDYIKGLGVNAIWLTPIQMSDSYHGYDISDYQQVDPKFGSKASEHSKNVQPTPASAMEDYKDLLAEAHKRGMAVIMDLVINHTAPTNKWFINSGQLDDEYRGYYQWGNNKTDSKNINEKKCWYPYGDHVYSYYAKFGSSMPELNYNYVATRAAVASIALNWCELGVDGFRMDAVKHIFMKDEAKVANGDKIVNDVTEKADYSSNLTKNMHFWRQLAQDVKSKYKNCFFVGENFDGNAYNVAPYYEGFDSCFDFYSYFNITSIAARANGNISTGPSSAHKFLSAGGEPSKHEICGNVTWDLVHVLAKNDEYRGGKSINGAFTSNHDIARTINRVAGTKSDSNGLTAQGNVSATNYATYDKLATLVQITELMLPGCTWIYYGDEIGMTGNFPQYEAKKDAQGKQIKFTADSPYADLYYRQPMKWTQNGKVGDGSMTTFYAVTGSGVNVGWSKNDAAYSKENIYVWDEVNEKTVPAATANSAHKAAITAFATAKGTTPDLIKGSLEDLGQDSDGFAFKIKRGNYLAIINMNKNGSVSAPSGYSLVNGVTYGTVNGTTVNGLSAALYKK